LKKHCIHCGNRFIPRDDRQHYCGSLLCRRARKRDWQRKKLATDADYQSNQADAQGQWRRNHPNYWRGYRESHPEYCARNRVQQRQRNGLRKRAGGGSVPLQPAAKIAKMDAAPPLKSGTYRLIPYGVPWIAKMDAMVVELSLVSTG